LQETSAELREQVRQVDARIAECRQQIAAREATAEHERSRLGDLQQQREAHQLQYLALSTRAGDVAVECQQAAVAIEQAQVELAACRRRLEEHAEATEAIATRLEALRQIAEGRRAAYVHLMRTAAAIGNQITAAQQQQSAAAARLARLEAEEADLDAQLAVCRADLDSQRGDLEDASAVADRRQAAARHAQSRLAAMQADYERALRGLAELRERHSATRERVAILKELEDRFDGVNAGTKEMLLRARQGGAAPLNQLRGLVADLLQTSLEHAPLIDAVLASVAQYLVVAPGQAFWEFLKDAAAGLEARVGFIRLDVDSPQHWLDDLDLSDEPGVVARADRLVETTPELRPLAERLLGRTWIVDTLPRALSLSQGAAHGLQLVTLAGEVVGPDGFLQVGPRQTASGLISRRSELRALSAQLVELEDRVRVADLNATRLKSEIADQARLAEARATEQLEARHRLAELQARLKDLTAREAGCQSRLDALRLEATAATREHDEAAALVERLGERLEAIEADLADLDGEIAAASVEIEGLEQQRADQSRQATILEVQQARAQEQVTRLEMQRVQLSQTQQERQRLLAEHGLEQARFDERISAALRAILSAQSTLATLYLAKEELESQLAARERELEVAELRRAALAEQLDALRGEIRSREEEIHAHELSGREIQLELATLAARLREDYQVELAEVAATAIVEEATPREEIENEIAELRRKMNHIGAVNLDALEELDELEARHRRLTSQHEDLAGAKHALEQILQRIDGDSRRMFSQTFETVRQHFQALFAKLFGGGHADLLVEPDVDILESGVEIVARPPGKEPRSISLLSGGEKTLTCVALLLAIFRSRPSPFCVLDEVDAALDEANIERFVGVLAEFLDWTQFIIITHSKRTMTCAHTLYGVTMEESGVSKRVAIRFEDVGDDGEILRRPAADNSQDETQAA
jgi:chromosome segregation protein